MVLDTGLEGIILTSAGDNAFRWRHGERLEDLFEDHCDALRRAGRGGDLAVDGPAGRLTYDELDAAARARIEAHLRRCDACRQRLDDLHAIRRAVDALRNQARLEGVTVEALSTSMVEAANRLNSIPR